MVKIPYGGGHLLLDEAAYPNMEVLKAMPLPPPKSGTGGEIVAEAMAAPISSPALRQLAEGKRTAVIIVSDHTRPVPSKDILPPMLAELRAGNPEIDITLLVATGCHRATTVDELRGKLGDGLYGRERIVVHDCDSPDNVRIGVLPSGAPLVINRLARDADLLVAEGFIEPHFFAGFSGGRKSVLPGICDRKTVLGNHCSAFIRDERARTGVLEGNPIHRDMVAAVKMARLAYIVNAVIDEKQRTVAAFAGDPIEAHREGCLMLAGHCGVRPRCRGDIVLTSNGGEPMDQNLYQAVKCMSAAEACAAAGGVIIACARCSGGTGGEDFFEAMCGHRDLAGFLDEIEGIPMERTLPDQWQYQILIRILLKHRVIVVTDPTLRDTVLAMHMEYAESIEEALGRAYTDRGDDAHLVVVPDGVSVIVQSWR